MERRDLLRTLVGGFVGGFFISPSRAQRERLNVVFLPVDDLNTHLNCYGHPAVRSPHMDRLAQMGVRFEHTYCQYPLCNPSRSSLLTGLRPDTTRIFDNRTHFRTHLPDVVTLPQLFRQTGYRTVSVGKIFHGGLDDPKAWDRVLQPSRPRRQAAFPRGGGVLWTAQEAQKARQQGPAPVVWQAVEGPDEALPDGQIAQAALEFLQSRPSEPFFLAVGFHKPHLPFVAPRKYFDLYDPQAIPLPEVRRDDWNDVPPLARTGKEWNEGLDETRWREAVRAYYACISYTDAQVGKILDALERQGLLKRTIVLLFGDHGFHLGHHGLWRKMTLFEESARAPFLLYVPKIGQHGVASPRLVEFVDFYPTLCELCGLKPPPNLEGLSLVPLLQEPQRPWKKAAFTQVNRGRSVRTERYRLTEWNDGSLELYDHEVDPNEFTNLASSKEHEKVREELRKLLRAGWRAALP